MRKALFTLGILLGMFIGAQAQVELKGGGGINFLGLSKSPDGFKSEAQVRQNAGALAKGPLTEDQMKDAETILAQFEEAAEETT